MAKDKRELVHYLYALQKMKIWQLLLLFVLLFGISAIFLRLNNVGMIERREAVYSADKIGDNEQIHGRLYDLQRYASSHMNAATGEVYLTEKYKRDSGEIAKKLQRQSSKGSVYARADKICRPRFLKDGFFSQAYLNCIKEETTKLPSSSQLETKFDPPDPSLYTFEFYSPLWSFDFAGVSVVLTALLAVVIVIRTIASIVVKALLKRKYHSI